MVGRFINLVGIVHANKYPGKGSWGESAEATLLLRRFNASTRARLSLGSDELTLE